MHYGTTSEGVVIRSTKELPPVTYHNEAVNNALHFIESSHTTYAIVDNGRNNDERSCVWVEKGQFYGMGYISNDINITEISELKEYITPYSGNGYIMQLINAYVLKYPKKVYLQNTHL